MLFKAVGFAFLVIGLGVVALHVQDRGEAAPAAHIAEGGFANLPLGFEPNHGQAPTEVQFIAKGAGFEAALGTVDVSLRTSPGQDGESVVAKLRWLRGAKSEPVAEERLPGDAHYFVGDDPAQWLTKIPTYGRVRYPEVYPGIDVVYYGTQGHLEYDFVLAPKADPGLIALQLTDERGQPLALTLDGEGNLSTEVGEQMLTMRRPSVYQEVDERRVDVDGEYELLADAHVGFRLGPYDSERTLVIDPVMSFSTYIGNNSTAFNSVATDSLGNAYFAGWYNSPGPDLGSLVQLTKVNSTGSAILYSTTFGGSVPWAFNASSSAWTVAVDAAGQAYVGGRTTTSDFPTVNPFQASWQGAEDGFITKFSADGSTILYSSFFGGSGYDDIRSVAVDAAGSAFVTGSAPSLNLPGSPSFPPGGNDDAFVAKIHPTGNSLLYWTFLGGTDHDTAFAIKVDAAGNAVVGGHTRSTDFPIATGAQQSVHAGGFYDAFVTSLNSSGRSLRYSTYLGGSGSDYAFALALDATGSPVVCGSTGSADFPVRAAAQATIGGSLDAFVTAMDGVNDLTNISYSTFFGGAGHDSCWGIAVDSAYNAYLVGHTTGSGFPLVRPLQATFGGGATDGYYAKLNTKGGPALYSSYLGGSGVEEAKGVALFGSAIFIGGSTTSFNFPLVNALQPQNSGGTNGFATKISARADMGISMLDSPDPVRLQNTLTYSIAVTNIGPDAATGVRVTDTIPAGTSLLSATSSQGTCTPGATVVCDLGLVNNPGSASVTIRVIPTQVRVVTNTATVARFEEDTFAANDSRSVTTTVRSRLGVSIAAAPGASGSVASNPAGINCGADCEEFYSSPTTVRLAATPGAGSQFIGWSGACSGTGLCYVLMDQDRNVTANFKRLQ